MTKPNRRPKPVDERELRRRIKRAQPGVAKTLRKFLDENDPIKALLKKHPGPWKIHEGVTYKWLVRSRAKTSETVSAVVAVTDHLVIARAIAALGRKK